MTKYKIKSTGKQSTNIINTHESGSRIIKVEHYIVNFTAYENVNNLIFFFGSK